MRRDKGEVPSFDAAVGTDREDTEAHRLYAFRVVEWLERVTSAA